MKHKTPISRPDYIQLETLRLSRQGTQEGIALDMAKEHAATLDPVVQWKSGDA